MWTYDRKLEFPVKIKNPNPAIAKIIITQLGGPDGELGAATRYLSQRYSMPYTEVVGTLTDVGIEDKYCAFYKNYEKDDFCNNFHAARVSEAFLFYLVPISVSIRKRGRAPSNSPSHKNEL